MLQQSLPVPLLPPHSVQTLDMAPVRVCACAHVCVSTCVRVYVCVKVNQKLHFHNPKSTFHPRCCRFRMHCSIDLRSSSFESLVHGLSMCFYSSLSKNSLKNDNTPHEVHVWVAEPLAHPLRVCEHVSACVCV
jgi:hypothetical protein